LCNIPAHHPHIKEAVVAPTGEITHPPTAPLPDAVPDTIPSTAPDMSSFPALTPDHSSIHAEESSPQDLPDANPIIGSSNLLSRLKAAALPQLHSTRHKVPSVMTPCPSHPRPTLIRSLFPHRQSRHPPFTHAQSPHLAIPSIRNTTQISVLSLASHCHIPWSY
jgi:hypothetical protein